MSNRQEFSVKTRRAAYVRSDGVCECGCGVEFGKERVEYDHVQACDLGGDNSLENCKALRQSCHKAKTRRDMVHIKKARRGERDRLGLGRKKSSFPGSRNSRFKKAVDGTVIDRETGLPV